VPRFSDPEPLTGRHAIDGFDCGVPSLNIWLIDYARGAMGAGSARTYVIVDRQQARVVGYHALAGGTVRHQNATARVSKGMPRHPIPVVLLARLAVDRSVQGYGLGAWLVKDAMRRALTVSKEMGIRAMLVRALDDNARSFYARCGFEPSPTDPHNLQIVIKDIRAALSASSAPQTPVRNDEEAGA
jgi:GNAT superfamily N-acetyltransferase